MPTALIGTALQLGGSLLSKGADDAANQAAADAAQFNPFNISGAGGNVQFGDNSVSVQGSQQQQMFQNMFANRAGQFGQGAGQGFQDFGNQIGNNIGGFFQGAQDASNPLSALNAGNMFSQFSNQNAQFGQQAGQGSFGLANMFGQQQTGVNEGVAQGLFGQAGQAFGNTNFDQLQSQNLAAQRASARPGEERLVNSKFQNLFNKGILSSSSGIDQLSDLNAGLQGVDAQRILSSQQFGNQLQQQNRQFGLAATQGGIGARGLDQQGNLARANIFGNMGQGLMNFGQGAGQAGFNTQFNMNNLVNSRGQQRLQNANQQFGFGQNAQAQDFSQLMGSAQGFSQGNADLRNLIALGGNLGQAQANAGANQGEFLQAQGGSPFGEFLGNAGAGLVPGGGGFLGFGG